VYGLEPAPVRGGRCRREADGAYTVPAKLLSQLVDTFTAPDVTLRQDGEVLRVTSGKSRGHLKGIDAAEFPEDRQDGGDTCTLPAAVLRRALTLAEWAAARDESRPVLKCVCLAAAGGTLVAQAADGTCPVVLVGAAGGRAGLHGAPAARRRRDDGAVAGGTRGRRDPLPAAISRTAQRAAPGVGRRGAGDAEHAHQRGTVPRPPARGAQNPHAGHHGAAGGAAGCGAASGRGGGSHAGQGGVSPDGAGQPARRTGRRWCSDGALHVWSTNASVGEQRTEIAASITSEGGEPLHFKLDGTYLVEMLGALDEALDGEPAEADDGAVTLRLTTALNPVRFGCAALPEWIGVLMPMSGGAE
jgi:hypothetical protein